MRKPRPYCTRIFESMMLTQAWQDLSGNEVSLYLQMVRKYRGNNNGAIVFGRREAERLLGVSSKTACKLFAGLERRGFIAPIVKGVFTLKLKATEWRLTEYDCDVTGEVATNDFIHWRPENAEKSEPKNKSKVEKVHLDRSRNSTYAGVKSTPPSEKREQGQQGLRTPIGGKSTPQSTLCHLPPSPTPTSDPPCPAEADWDWSDLRDYEETAMTEVTKRQ
jgi:hypothetical protein